MTFPDGRHERLPPSPRLGVGGRSGARRRIRQRHLLMLLLALEVLVVGASNADRYQRRPAVTVDTPIAAGHVIT